MTMDVCYGKFGPILWVILGKVTIIFRYDTASLCHINGYPLLYFYGPFRVQNLFTRAAGYPLNWVKYLGLLRHKFAV